MVAAGRFAAVCLQCVGVEAYCPGPDNCYIIAADVLNMKHWTQEEIRLMLDVILDLQLMSAIDGFLSFEVSFEVGWCSI